MTGERTQELVHIHPIIFRETNKVMAWIFRLKLTQDGKEALDDCTIELDEGERKPLTEWTRPQVLVLVNAALSGVAKGRPMHPRVLGLHKLLDTRLLIEEQMDFDVMSLPE